MGIYSLKTLNKIHFLCSIEEKKCSVRKYWQKLIFNYPFKVSGYEVSGNSNWVCPASASEPKTEIIESSEPVLWVV